MSAGQNLCISQTNERPWSVCKIIANFLSVYFSVNDLFQTQMDMLPNMIVERLVARRVDPLAERQNELRPSPEFRQLHTRLSPPRRRRILVSQNSVPTPSTLTPFASMSTAQLPESSVSLPATPSDTQARGGSHP